MSDNEDPEPSQSPEPASNSTSNSSISSDSASSQSPDHANRQSSDPSKSPDLASNLSSNTSIGTASSSSANPISSSNMNIGIASSSSSCPSSSSMGIITASSSSSMGIITASSSSTSTDDRKPISFKTCKVPLDMTPKDAVILKRLEANFVDFVIGSEAKATEGKSEFQPKQKSEETVTPEKLGNSSKSPVAEKSSNPKLFQIKKSPCAVNQSLELLIRPSENEPNQIPRRENACQPSSSSSKDKLGEKKNDGMINVNAVKKQTPLQCARAMAFAHATQLVGELLSKTDADINIPECDTDTSGLDAVCKTSEDEMPKKCADTSPNSNDTEVPDALEVVDVAVPVTLKNSPETADAFNTQNKSKIAGTSKSEHASSGKGNVEISKGFGGESDESHAPLTDGTETNAAYEAQACASCEKPADALGSLNKPEMKLDAPESENSCSEKELVEKGHGVEDESDALLLESTDRHGIKDEQAKEDVKRKTNEKDLGVEIKKFKEEE